MMTATATSSTTAASSSPRDQIDHPPSSWQLGLWPAAELSPTVDVLEVSRLFDVAAQQEQALLLLDHVVRQLREARAARKALQRLNPHQLSAAMAYRTHLLRHGAEGQRPEGRGTVR